MKVNEHELIVFYSDEIEVQTHVTFYFRKVCLRLTSAFSKHSDISGVMRTELFVCT